MRSCVRVSRGWHARYQAARVVIQDASRRGEEVDRHYNVHRPHRALGQVPPLGPSEPVALVPIGRVVRRDRLGGLIHAYAQAA
jgi:hypothetical protein